MRKRISVFILTAMMTVGMAVPAVSYGTQAQADAYAGLLKDGDETPEILVVREGYSDHYADGGQFTALESPIIEIEGEGGDFTGTANLSGSEAREYIRKNIFPVSGRFSDVPINAWYYNDVKKAVDTGLINGYEDGTYRPDRNMTYAEAVKLAAVMHKLAATGSSEFQSGSPWYQPYVDYAKRNGIINRDYDWNKAATRAGYMEIFANAIPDRPTGGGIKSLTAMNTVVDGSIPDVSMSHPQAAAIYKLYRAGILQGSDDQHNCKPGSNIRRSEVAAILTRMMSAGERISFTM